jgi:hypothetical protein
MNAIPDSAGQNLVEFRFIAVSIPSKNHLLDARRAASTSPRNLSSGFALRRLTLVQNFSRCGHPELRRYYSSSQERRFHGRAR